MGVSKQTLRAANRRRLSNKEFNLLLRGKYTPVKFSVSRMNKRVRDIEKAFPNEKIDRQFAFPAAEFYRVMREYRNKSLKPEEPTKRKTKIYKSSHCR